MKTLFPLLIASLAASAVVTSGCEKPRKPPPKYDPLAQVTSVAWDAPDDAQALVEVAAKERSLELPTPRRFPECHELLTHGGQPHATFPFPDRTERALAVVSCDMEASLVERDGTRIYAWGELPDPGSRARDLMVAAWGPDGELRWSARMDRDRQAANWVANFRRSFLVRVGSRHICFGTLWEGETQAQCVNPENGELRWSGSLPFWSGIEPQPGQDGFYVADLSALTKRYPYSGAEMRHLKLPGLGGRSGYYASDGEALYFATSRDEQPRLIAYEFATFEPRWSKPLPENPAPAVSHAWKDLGILVLKIGDVVHALDTKTGASLWAYDVGDDVPSFAAHGDTLFVLNRRPDDPNMLFALDPRTGDVQWRSTTPSGTLKVDSVEGVLVLGSVRAVQPVPSVSGEASRE